MSSQHQKISLPVLGILALAIVGLVFFDIVFLDRTLQPSNIVPYMGKPDGWQASSAFIPALNPETIASDGFADLNASAWQFEPARYVMARNFREGNSPWWNPYSASGTLGPEVLVDIKFSPHTLISAWLFDASPASFDFGLLIIYCVGVFFVLLVLREIFQLGWLAALAGTFVYLLNGFALPNLNTHIGQPYFFSPVLLFSILFFIQKNSLWRWFFLVLSHAILLTINILTTLSIVLITVHLLGLVYFIFGSGDRRRTILEVFQYGVLIISAVIVAFMLVGPLWFPIVDSFFVTDMVGDFNTRTKWGWTRSIDSLLSVFTPRHFWDDGSHVPRFSIYPQAGLEKNDNLIAYLGVVVSLVASCAFANTRRQYLAVIWLAWALLVLSYMRIFGFSEWMEYVPVLRSIGGQYWGCMAAVVMPLLVAFGLHNIRLGKVPVIPLLLVLLLQWSAFAWLWWRLGWPTISLYSHYVVLYLFFGALAGGLLLLAKRQYFNASLMAALVLILMLVELLSYMNTVRPFRYSPLDSPPEYISFLRQNIADGRVLNIGQHGTLYPEYGAMYGVKQADTQNPGLFPWYEHFFEAYFGNDTFMFLALDGSAERKRKKSSRKMHDLDEAALDVASIKYVLVDDSAMLYLDFLQKKNYPLVYRKNSVSIFENRDYIPSVSLAPASLGEKIDATRLDGRADILTYRNTEVIVLTETDDAMTLVLSDVWHPSWNATVDGVAVEVARVNEAFRGIALPAGRHQVRFYYDPPALRYGIYAMFVAALMMLLLLVLRVWQVRAKNER